MSLTNFAFRMRALRFVALASALSFGALTNCSSDNVNPEYVERPVEDIYQDAAEKMADKQWFAAAQQFDEVERQHPYSIWARRAVLMSGYCYYQSNRYDQAIDSADRFIQLHPGNKDAPYAYYLKAVSLYEQITDVGRDQKKTQDSLTALQDIVQRYPNTEYARDAKLKVDLAFDHLAGKEMDVGRYYLRSGQYISAINRFRTVIEKFQTTSHTPEALERLTEAYLALGIVREAQTAAAVLGYNYPGSPWYQQSFVLLTDANVAPQKDQESWIAKAFGGVL